MKLQTINKIKKIILILIFNSFIFFLLSCNRNENLIIAPEKIPSLQVLYTNAYNLYEQGDWNGSIELFKKVENNYSYTEWAQKASVMIIYMYYEANESFKTLENIKKFKKIYPKSDNISYVNYIEALTFYDQINVTSKDQTYTEEALKKFRYIIKTYPDTTYAEDSFLKIDLINEQLAGKEIYLARYYMKKSKWIPAIKRLKIILDKYERTIYSKEALHRLVEIYYKLGNINESKKYAAILGYNFNDSDWYKKSYKIVGDKNYSLRDEKVKKNLKDRIIDLFKFSK